MTKIGTINGIMRKPNLVKTSNFVKKVALPIAGLTGLSLLRGASGGPTWQFEGVKPRGDVKLIEHMDSVDNTLFESIKGRVDYIGDETGLADLVEQAGDKLQDFGDAIADGLSDWSEAVVKIMSETL